MNIYFVSFQSYNNNIPIGMVKFVLPLVKEVQKTISTTYYVSSARNSNQKVNIKEVSFVLKWLFKFINIVYKIINKIPLLPKVTNGKIRLIQEVLFDFLFLYKLKEPVVLISSTYLNRSIEKNKKMGGLNVFLAGNPDDREIHKLLHQEMRKYNIFISDAYTYTKRINFIDQSLGKFDHIFTFTKSEFQTYLRNIDNKKISYLEATIKPNKITFNDKNIEKYKQLTFCYIAHTVWLKGLFYLLEAWKQIKSDNILLVIGGSIDVNVKTVIKEKFDGLNNVHFEGFSRDINKFMRTSHVCIIPSLLDAGPATISEALYCGLPVITTDGCGSSTLVKDGHNGFVVPAANSNAIAEKIKWFIDNQNEIEVMSQNAEATMESLENSNQEQKLAEHILTIIDELKKEIL